VKYHRTHLSPTSLQSSNPDGTTSHSSDLDPDDEDGMSPMANTEPRGGVEQGSSGPTQAIPSGINITRTPDLTQLYFCG